MPEGHQGKKRIALFAVLPFAPAGVLLTSLPLSSAALAATPCALHEPDAPRPGGVGTVLRIQDPAMARATIPTRQAQRGGAIDPRHLDDVRVVVRQDDGIFDTYNVPAGMPVHIGDRVKLQGSYRSTAFTCSYIPHMAIPDEAPGA